MSYYNDVFTGGMRVVEQAIPCTCINLITAAAVSQIKVAL